VRWCGCEMIHSWPQVVVANLLRCI
jgi:hypothetical protein